ncbi:MAG: polysaccharide biosynthesis/export family protein [Vicinamibacteria bacterium]
MVRHRFLRPLGAALVLHCALLPAPATAQAPARPDIVEGDYVIGPGDVLQIFVWKEPELTRDVTVRVDGKITVPLLGDLPAAGRTPQQLGTELGKALARFLSSPQVTLGVAQANSSRFYVMGQVNTPGVFPLAGRVTVLQGLALAGGLREFAKTDSIQIVRQSQGQQSFVPINYKKLEDGRDITQNVLLRPGDTVLVP